jgi:glycosyltransferase involved in cell wall biosynthesis
MVNSEHKKVAIVHDWITGLRGGERCLIEFLKIYPNADVFTLVHVPGVTSELIDSRVKQQSWLGRLPSASKIYRHFLPLYPLAIRSLNLTGYDLVISLSHAAAKNVTIPKGTTHLCYCFTPMRYIWDQSEAYFGKYKNSVAPILKFLQKWDQNGATRVTEFSAISSFVSARIRKYYHRRAEVIHPPVNTDWIRPISSWKKGDAFLFAGALVPYKRPDVVVHAFNKLGLPLIVAGNGGMLRSLRDIAKPNIMFVENASDSELAEIYRTSRALVFPAIEDFGMIPVECMAAGRPVIGMDRGGLKESIIGDRIPDLSQLKSKKTDTFKTGSTGILLSSKATDLVEELINGVRYFEQIEDKILPSYCVEQAKKFSSERFRAEWGSFAQKNC